MWPYLWNNPINNLFVALRDMLKGHEEIILINYYFGEYISSDMMPWHYRIVWFLISTPIVILFLFFASLLIKLSKSNFINDSFTKKLELFSSTVNNK